MRHNLAFAGMLQLVTGSDYVVLNVVESIVELGFQESVAVAQLIHNRHYHLQKSP